jgi:hypothetical protein
MSHLVKTLVKGLELPDGNLYPNINTTVTLTDEQFATLNASDFVSDLQDLGVAFTAITVTASPFTYTVAASGTLLINPSGATISALTWNTLTVPPATALLPVLANDVLVVTYTGGTPLMNIRNQS